MVDFNLNPKKTLEEKSTKIDFKKKSNIETAIAAASILSPQRLAQNRLVIRILNECVAKLKLSMIIPKIFENPLTVAQLLKDTPHKYLADLLLKYLKERAKGNFKNKKGGFVDAQYLDDKLINLLNEFHLNHEILDLLPNWFVDTTVTDHNIMEAFDLLNTIVDDRLHRSAVIEIEKEKEMHLFHQENSNLRKEIEYLRRRVRNQKHHMLWKLAIRTGDTQKFQEELTVKKWQNFNLIRQEQTSQALRIKQLNFGHQNKLLQMNEESNRLCEEYRKMKIANAKQLKTVREEKNKLLIQLESTIEKHDRVLGEKIKENVYLQDEYDKQREEMDAFMVGFLALEKEYNDIVQAEAEEENRKWTEKANLFFQTRAVRIIQRYFRRYLKEKRKEEKAFKKMSKKPKKK